MGCRLGAAVSGLGVALACVAAAAACESFASNEGEPTTTTTDASVESSAAPDDAGTATIDADTRPPACPSRAPACNPTVCTRRTLFESPTGASPFGTVVDSTHVYWLEQPGGRPGYDGGDKAKLRRVSKKGDGKVEDLVRDQNKAVALERVGDVLYWATRDDAAATSTLWRTKTSSVCNVDCPAPQPVFVLTGDHVVALRAVGSQLFAVQGNGPVYRVDLSQTPSVSFGPLANPGKFPALTTTATHAYASALLDPRIVRIEPTAKQGSDVAWATVPDGGSNAGLAPTTSDCSAVWGYRRASAGAELVRADLDGGPISVLAAGNSIDVFGIAADARYVYVGGANGGGLLAFDKENPSARYPAQKGNVWRIAVDDDGIYWGEHSSEPRNDAGLPSGGSIYMLVK